MESLGLAGQQNQRFAFHFDGRQNWPDGPAMLTKISTLQKLLCCDALSFTFPDLKPIVPTV